jgi:hypothetical protein
MKYLKHLPMFALIGAIAPAPAFAVQKLFTCSAAAFSAEIEMPTTDPRGVSGVLTSDKDERVIELYEIYGSRVHGPKGTKLFLAVGWGDGTTDFVYLAIPASLASAQQGQALTVTRIETSAADENWVNPMGVTRTSLRCSVDN